MSAFPAPEERPDPIPPTPVIELGVPDARGHEGFVLRAPRSEPLLWDLDAEIVSARRRWLEDLGGWWIDASYLPTVIDITLRSFSSVLLLHGAGGDRLLSRDGVTAVQERLL